MKLKCFVTVYNGNGKKRYTQFHLQMLPTYRNKKEFVETWHTK